MRFYVKEGFLVCSGFSSHDSKFTEFNFITERRSEFGMTILNICKCSQPMSLHPLVMNIPEYVSIIFSISRKMPKIPYKEPI